MSFSRGRNNIEASIIDSAIIYHELLDELESFFKNKIDNIVCIIEEEKGYLHENKELFANIQQPYMELIFHYQEIFQECLEMLLIKIYSYIEKHLEVLMGTLGIKTREAVINKPIKGKVQRKSKIELYYLAIQKACSFEASLIEKWAGFQEFRTTRNSIVHNKQTTNKQLTTKYLKESLHYGNDILLYIELQIRKYHLQE